MKYPTYAPAMIQHHARMGIVCEILRPLHAVISLSVLSLLEFHLAVLFLHSNLLPPMGQRHQLFIIAKVGKRHRCLAAMHHQWLYGERAVDVASRLQLIFQSPANRHALSCELIEAYKKSDKFWDGTSF